MVLSKREKYIGIVAGAAVALLGISTLVIDPFISRLDSLDADRRNSLKTLSDNSSLLIKEKNLQSDWQKMLNNGLEADDSIAESQTRHMQTGPATRFAAGLPGLCDRSRGEDCAQNSFRQDSTLPTTSRPASGVSSLL